VHRILTLGYCADGVYDLDRRLSDRRIHKGSLRGDEQIDLFESCFDKIGWPENFATALGRSIKHTD
jgi:hypothetical protein